MLIDVQAELDRVQGMTKEEAGRVVQDLRKALEHQVAIGRHDARDSVRIAAVAGKLAHRTDRAARRGLRARGARR